MRSKAAMSLSEGRFALGDLVVWSSASGAYVGLTLEGSIVKPRENYNDEYYGRPIAARAILNMNEGHNPGAGPLRHDLP